MAGSSGCPGIGRSRAWRWSVGGGGRSCRIVSAVLFLSRVTRIEALEAENAQLRGQLKRVTELEDRLAELDSARRSFQHILGVDESGETGAAEGMAEEPAEEPSVAGGDLYVQVEPLTSLGESALYEIRHALHTQPLDGPLTRSFGRVGGAGDFHTGVDIAGMTHAPIRTAGEGVVSSVGWSETLGWVLVISHSVRLDTVYGTIRRSSCVSGTRSHRARWSPRSAAPG